MESLQASLSVCHFYLTISKKRKLISREQTNIQFVVVEKFQKFVAKSRQPPYTYIPPPPKKKDKIIYCPKLTMR